MPPCLIDDPFEDYSKILGIFRKKEQSQMFNSFSYLLDLYFCVLSATQIKHMITIITRKIQKCRK